MTSQQEMQAGMSANHDSSNSIQRIKAQIRGELAAMEEVPAVDQLNDDEALGGVLDSITMLELVASLEDRFSLKISEDEMGWENFSTINNIASFLAEKGVEA